MLLPQVHLYSRNLLPEVHAYLDRFRAARPPIRVLEVGCGRWTYFDYSDAERVVGIDLSPEQVASNTWIDEGIVGDVQTHRLAADEFDLVVCWDLLEHLPDPTAALDNMAHALKRDGVIVIGLPNVASVKGLVTKFTPHSFHLWFFRVIRKSPRIAGGGEGPFPTYLRWSLRAPALRAWAARSGLSVEVLHAYESPVQESLRRQLKLTGAPWRVLRALVRVLSLNQVVADKTDFAIVLRSDASP